MNPTLRPTELFYDKTMHISHFTIYVTLPPFSTTADHPLTTYSNRTSMGHCYDSISSFYMLNILPFDMAESKITMDDMVMKN